MPMFDTKCELCGDKRNDVLLSVGAAPARCLKCGARTLKQIPVSTGVKLKGKGWARDGYAS